jgi:hypothetical protein
MTVATSGWPGAPTPCPSGPTDANRSRAGERPPCLYLPTVAPT